MRQSIRRADLVYSHMKDGVKPPAQTPSSRTRFIPAMFFTACVSASRFSDGASSKSTTETAMFPRERLTRSEIFSPVSYTHLTLPTNLFV